jgi:GNAT superfamily N-acetyltransferase
MTVVTPAEPSNAEEMARLAEEMDRFYGATDVEPLKLRVQQINGALFHESPSAYALLAWDDGRLVGFASYSFLWPAVGLTRSLYLKELYVIETARRKSIGTLLMRQLYVVALKHDCSRVEWTTDRDNRGAQRFYAELGVAVAKSKVFYRVEGDELYRESGA